MSTPYIPFTENRKRFLAFDPMSIEKNRELVLGSGQLGGKAKGLLYAREALLGSDDPATESISVPESRFLSTDLFQEFVHEHHINDMYQDGASFETIERACLNGSLNSGLRKSLEALAMELDYPLAIRSSALLEDSLRYSFAGKYLTVFAANQGSPQDRLMELEKAIKRVYASTFGPDAVAYRHKHKLEHEEMGVIIQQLQGRQRGQYFYPELSGVGFSRNFRRWTERIRTEDGVVRIVFGLGTRCTERGYARSFSLTNVDLRPEGNVIREVQKYSQETMDALDMASGDTVTFNINARMETAKHHPHFPVYAEVYSPRDETISSFRPLAYRPHPGDKVVFTFARLKRVFPEVFELPRFIFGLLEREMGVSVDIEFAFEPEERYFSLLQARPLSSWEEYRLVEIPQDLEPNSILLRSDRMLTNGTLLDVPFIVYVDHEEYRDTKNKYSVVQEIGRINRELGSHNYILVGPGRWGSSHPEQGVPVRYSDISNCLMVVEVGIRADDFVPELSHGTHFFADLEIDGTLYMPVFDTVENNLFHREWFLSSPSLLTHHPAVRVIPGRFNAYLDGRGMEGVVIHR